MAEPALIQSPFRFLAFPRALGALGGVSELNDQRTATGS
jgi:hypothetical protein